MWGRKGRIALMVPTPQPPNTDEADRYWRHEMDELRVQRDAETLAKYHAEDEAERVHARIYKPPVKVKTYEAGRFLCCGEQEWPAAYITAIDAVEMGQAPRMEWNQYRIPEEPLLSPRPAQPAMINVRLASGQTGQVSISRHKLDLLLGALRAAWKGKEVARKP